MPDCTLHIKLDRPGGVYRGGEEIAGRVLVRCETDTSCESLRVERLWQTRGSGNRDEGPREGVTLFEGKWKAGKRYEYPFRFTAPASPLSYAGRHVEVVHAVTATADIPWAVDVLAEETFELVAGGTGGRGEAPGEEGAFQIVDSATGFARTKAGLVAGAVMVFFGLMLLVIGIGILLLIPGMILFSVALWHAMARLAVGDVRVEIGDRTLRPGATNTMGVRFTPPKSLSSGGVTAKLRCVERSVRGSGKHRRVFKHTVHEQDLTLGRPGELPGGKPVEQTCTFAVPRSEAYTFTAKHNRVTWDMTVRIGIPFWPDWTQRIALVMAPARSVERPSAVMPEPVAPLSAAPIPVPPPAVEPAKPAEPSPSESPPPVPDAAPDRPAPPEPEAAPEPMPDAGDPAPLLRDILSADRFSGARQRLIDDAKGRAFAFTVEAGRVEWTVGLNTSPEFRNGRTIIGTQPGDAAPIAVRFPESRNAEIEAIGPGTLVPVSGRLVEWNALHNRGEFEVASRDARGDRV